MVYVNRKRNYCLYDAGVFPRAVSAGKKSSKDDATRF
jgi:hypothetical protein